MKVLWRGCPRHPTFWPNFAFYVSPLPRLGENKTSEVYVVGRISAFCLSALNLEYRKTSLFAFHLFLFWSEHVAARICFVWSFIQSVRMSKTTDWAYKDLSLNSLMYGLFYRILVTLYKNHRVDVVFPE